VKLDLPLVKEQPSAVRLCGGSLSKVAVSALQRARRGGC